MCFTVICKLFRALVTVASIARMPPIEYSDEPLSGNDVVLLSVLPDQFQRKLDLSRRERR
jgi:hypothetical protein